MTRPTIDRPKRSLIRRVLAASPLPQGWPRWAALAGCTIALISVALLDRAVTVQIALGATYLLPVIAVSFLVSARSGYALAALAAGLLVWNDLAFGIRTEPVAVTVNGALRACTFMFVAFLIGSLRRAVTEAEGARASTDRFLAAAAHQLRTPIAGVMASAEALTTNPDPATRAQLTDHLTLTSQRISKLLSTLLQYGRLSAMAGPEIVPTDLTALCRHVLNGIAPANGVALHADGQVMAMADPDQLREAVANLVDNAVQRCDGRVDVHVQHDGGRSLVIVHDDGPGVPTGQHEAIFEWFVRQDDRGGAGLGLPIARSLVRTNGGDLVSEDRGFVLSLPAAPARAAGRTPQ